MLRAAILAALLLTGCNPSSKAPLAPSASPTTQSLPMPGPLLPGQVRPTYDPDIGNLRQSGDPTADDLKGDGDGTVVTK